MHVRPATPDDAAAITDIYNQAVRATTASFDIEPKSVEERLAWLADRAPRHPVIVAEDESTVAGWGALSRYSERPAYDATVEISVYVDAAWHRRGVGRLLTDTLLARASAIGVHSVIARICTENAASVSLCKEAGFAEAGVMHEVGWKFERWLDVATYEYIVREAAHTR